MSAKALSVTAPGVGSGAWLGLVFICGSYRLSLAQVLGMYELLGRAVPAFRQGGREFKRHSRIINQCFFVDRSAALRAKQVLLLKPRKLTRVALAAAQALGCRNALSPDALQLRKVFLDGRSFHRWRSLFLPNVQGEPCGGQRPPVGDPSEKGRR